MVSPRRVQAASRLESFPGCWSWVLRRNPASQAPREVRVRGAICGKVIANVYVSRPRKPERQIEIPGGMIFSGAQKLGVAVPGCGSPVTRRDAVPRGARVPLRRVSRRWREFLNGLS